MDVFDPMSLTPMLAAFDFFAAGCHTKGERVSWLTHKGATLGGVTFRALTQANISTM